MKTLENFGWDGAKVLMDKAYEGDETWQPVLDLGMIPVVPPKVNNRLTSWEYERKMYKKRKYRQALESQYQVQ